MKRRVLLPLFIIGLIIVVYAFVNGLSLPNDPMYTIRKAGSVYIMPIAYLLFCIVTYSMSKKNNDEGYSSDVNKVVFIGVPNGDSKPVTIPYKKDLPPNTLILGAAGSGRARRLIIDYEELKKECAQNRTMVVVDPKGTVHQEIKDMAYQWRFMQAFEKAHAIKGLTDPRLIEGEKILIKTVLSVLCELGAGFDTVIQGDEVEKALTMLDKERAAEIKRAWPEKTFELIKHGVMHTLFVMKSEGLFEFDSESFNIEDKQD